MYIFTLTFGEAMSIEIVFRDLATTILAVGTGALCYNKLNCFLKILFWQTAIYFIVDLTASFCGHNVWIFNLYVLIETVLVLVASIVLLSGTFYTRYVKLLMITLLLIYIPEMFFLKNANDFVIISVLTSYLFSACVYIGIIHIHLTSTSFIHDNFSVIVVSFGLVIYSAGCIPCLAAMQNLVEVSSSVSQSLFQKIVVVLGSIRYFTLFLGFLIQGSGIQFRKKV